MAIVVSHYAFFVGLALKNTRHWVPGSGLRFYIPLLVVAGYWTLASIFNRHTAVVSPSGVRLTLFPVPTGSGQFITREEITVCYARYIVETTDSGLESNHHFTMGVETRAGLQADIHSPYKTAEDSLAAAEDVIVVLNSNRAYSPIEVRLVTVAMSYPTLRRQMLLWVIISIIALMLGMAWDRAEIAP